MILRVDEEDADTDHTARVLEVERHFGSLVRIGDGKRVEGRVRRISTSKRHAFIFSSTSLCGLQLPFDGEYSRAGMLQPFSLLSVKCTNHHRTNAAAFARCHRL